MWYLFRLGYWTQLIPFSWIDLHLKLWCTAHRTYYAELMIDNEPPSLTLPHMTTDTREFCTDQGTTECRLRTYQIGTNIFRSPIR